MDPINTPDTWDQGDDVAAGDTDSAAKIAEDLAKLNVNATPFVPGAGQNVFAQEFSMPGNNSTETTGQVVDSLPPPLVEFDPKTNIRTVTEYKLDDNGKKVRVVRTFKVERVKFPKSVARRKGLQKFGSAERDPPGPNPANTNISKDVFMEFVHSKDVQNNDVEEDPLAKLKGVKMVACRICHGDHRTTHCPYKDTLAPVQDILGGEIKPAEAGGDEEGAERPAKPGGGGPSKYIAPGMKGQRGDEVATIRVTNLSEDTREADLQELFRPFGNISRIYLAKDKITGQSKGFAFINFHRREDAARAIAGVSGHRYGYLILNVEWAKNMLGGENKPADAGGDE